MMKSTRTLPILGCVATLLFGCATGTPGETAGAIAPRMMSSTTNRSNEHPRWDNAITFGAVPAGRQKEGDAKCRILGYEQATGYHPHAQSRLGLTYPNGGFYCARCNEVGGC
ncbi:hypothetical protein [uncultured Thiodictyon sp.]|uniref:hypothetical protein n=1 Tax=uncultured Thiodictyon sp. TaxID=1846217 RepID=UPI0025CF68DC|nr:hypothetical protein [uncultured Thiodictyon sp.]